MENSEISIHEWRVYEALRQGGWMTSASIAEKANVAKRTARHHCLRLVKLGIVDQAEVFPAHRYRLSKMAQKRNLSYCQRLELAAEVFSHE